MRLSSLLLLFLCLTFCLPHVTADDQKLEATEKEIKQLMKTLKGDRFSATTGTTLTHLASTTTGIPQFVSRLFHGIWYIHQNQFQQAHDIFQQIIKDKQAPSKQTTRAVELLMELMIHIIGLSQSTTIDPIAERECQSIARRLIVIDEPLTKNYEKISWMWENLIHTEATWLLQNLPDHNNPGNKKCVYVPGLLAQEFYDNKQFRAAELLEQKYGEIMEELTPFLKHYESTLFHDVGGNTAETDKNLVLQGKWQDISLWSAGQKNNDVCKSLPKLCAILESEIPEVTRNVQGHALLSRLSAGTIVNRHHGYSNNQLTLHLGLIVPSKTAHPDYDIDLGIEVNNVQGTWTQGKVIVFDDSFYHSVWYKYNKKGEKIKTNKDDDGKSPKTSKADDPNRPSDRLVLLLRGYHPEYTLEERAHLVMTHAETPWTIEQRVTEHKRLLTDKNVRMRWEEDKKKFLSVYKKEEKKQEKEKHAHEEL